jgi:hypothetical protein
MHKNLVWMRCRDCASSTCTRQYYEFAFHWTHSSFCWLDNLCRRDKCSHENNASPQSSSALDGLVCIPQGCADHAASSQPDVRHTAFQQLREIYIILSQPDGFDSSLEQIY